MFNYLMGVVAGMFIVLTFSNIRKSLRTIKEIKKIKKNIKKIKQVQKETQLDEVSIEFNKRKQEIAHKNKFELVKAKISQLEQSDLHKRLAEEISSQIIVVIAEQMVELDRLSGKIDDLYS